MKTKFLFILFFINLLLLSCKKDKQHSNSCETYQKEKALKAAPATPRTEIWKWKYQNKHYLYVTLPEECCDQFTSVLYDEHCNVHCYPDGGITGNGDGQCEDLKANTEKNLLWKDTR